jgi:hypothetical protein
MELSWLDDEHTNINVLMEEGERLVNVEGPGMATVPVAPGNADYEYLMANYGTQQIGPPSLMGHGTGDTHGQRTKTDAPRRRR